MSKFIYYILLGIAMVLSLMLVALFAAGLIYIMYLQPWVLVALIVWPILYMLGAEVHKEYEIHKRADSIAKHRG